MRNPFKREARSPLDNPSVPVFAALLGMMEGQDNSSGVAVSPQRAMRVVAFLACVKLLSETIASLPRPVFTSDGNGGRVADLEDPRVRKLALAPNPDMTAFVFWTYVIVCMAAYGNAYVWIEYDESGNIDLWPVAPNKIKLQRDAQSGRRVWVVEISDQRKVWLNDEEVLHFQGIGLETELGLSNVAQARQALGISIAAEDYAGRMFEGDGSPGAVLQTEKPMTDAQFKEFHAHWQASHEGLRNAHKFALLPPGMTYAASGFDPTNLQMIEARKFQVREMARLFRIPPHMIGDLEGSATFASVEQMSIDFVTYTLMPWLVNIEQVVNTKLFAGQKDIAEGRFMQHDTTPLLRADSVSRSKIDAVYRYAGIKTGNEVRESIGLPPKEGGDVLWQPVNQSVVGPDGIPVPPQTGVPPTATDTADPSGNDATLAADAE